jgi:hypothetical protein
VFELFLKSASNGSVTLGKKLSKRRSEKISAKKGQKFLGCQYGGGAETTPPSTAVTN